MADDQENQGAETAPRKDFSVVTFLAGLFAAWAALYAFTRGEIDNILEVEWLLAGGAVLVGSLMLANTLRPQRKR